MVSIGPLLAVPGIADALRERRSRVVAVSPIVAGAALKGPADRLMAELGVAPRWSAWPAMYAEVAGTLVIDDADAALADEVEALGLRCGVAPTVMTTAADANGCRPPSSTPSPPRSGDPPDGAPPRPRCRSWR